MNKSVEEQDCPLCGSDGELEYTFIANRTHMWSCNNCPCIMMEYYTDTNVNDLAQHLDPKEVKS